MAIEIAPRKKFEVPFWILIPNVLCVILILVLAGTYFYFGFQLKKISQEIDKKEAEFIPLEKAIKEKQAELIPLGQKINDFGGLISSHKNTLKIFDFLEKTCLPNVWFSNFVFLSQENQAIVSGQADSFATVENQSAVFKKEPVVKAVNLFDVLINDEGEVEFIFTLTFDPSIY